MLTRLARLHDWMGAVSLVRRSGLAAAVAGTMAVGLPTLSPVGAQTRACTLVGCSTGVQLEIPRSRATQVTICVNRRCERRSLDRTTGSSTAFVPSGRQGGRVDVRVILRDADGHVLRRVGRRQVPLRPFRPNGPSCEPTCWKVVLRLERNFLRVIG